MERERKVTQLDSSGSYIPRPEDDPVGYVVYAETYGKTPDGRSTMVVCNVMEQIIEQELWRAPRNTHFNGFATFADWVHDCLGWTREGGVTAVKAILKSRYGQSPSFVGRFMREYEKTAGPGAPEGNRNAVKGENNPSSDNGLNDERRRGTDPAYISRRLERDGHGDLAEQVRAGSLTAKEAARRVGYLPDPRSDAEVLKRLRKLISQASPAVLKTIQEELAAIPEKNSSQPLIDK